MLGSATVSGSFGANLNRDYLLLRADPPILGYFHSNVAKPVLSAGRLVAPFYLPRLSACSGYEQGDVRVLKCAADCGVAMIHLTGTEVNDEGT